jgi:undecaprenyl diphosphate synthase
MPRHIAVIMDGNGRWARQHSLPRIEGHRRGATVVRDITQECCRLGLQQLTLYCLSSENWKRPREELDFLMQMLQYYLSSEQATLLDNNLQLTVIGRRDRIPDPILQQMDAVERATRENTGTRLCLAINYGGRAEIVDAIRSIAEQVRRGELSPEDIDEQTVSDTLYTRGLPDPDLLIRSAGEMRLSNFLLWQISYSELWVTERYWPDFRVADLHEAIHSYARRQRRFGGLTEQKEPT